MAKTNPSLMLGYNPTAVKPAGKPVGSGSAGQDLVNKIRSGKGGAWGGGKW